MALYFLPTNSNRMRAKKFLSDDDLIFLISEQDSDFQRAASTLYDRYASKLIGFFSRRGISQDVGQDLLQEVLLKFIDSIVKKKGKCSIGLLWSIASSILIDHFRCEQSQKRDSRLQVSYDEISEQLQGPANVEGNELSDCVRRCVYLFGEKWPEHSHTLQLAMFEEWSMRELSEFLGRSYGATRQYVSECRKKLRQLVLKNCRALLGNGHV